MLDSLLAEPIIQISVNTLDFGLTRKKYEHASLLLLQHFNASADYARLNKLSWLRRSTPSYVNWVHPAFTCHDRRIFEQ
ncbi:hypothetical protein SB5_14755 [Pseudomonas oryzihabitans]|nr:hypothetical protein SB5_14755 [Pseudomonas psychrotolerans]